MLPLIPGLGVRLSQRTGMFQGVFDHVQSKHSDLIVQWAVTQNDEPTEQVCARHALRSVSIHYTRNPCLATCSFVSQGRLEIDAIHFKSFWKCYFIYSMFPDLPTIRFVLEHSSRPLFGWKQFPISAGWPVILSKIRNNSNKWRKH